MNITTEQLNKVAQLIGTTDKSVVIGAVIKTLVDSGMDATQAFDAVFGQGAYVKMAGNIWDAMNAA